MDKQNLTAAELLDYLRRGGYESRIAAMKGVWVLVLNWDSEKVERWYEKAKPLADLQAMRSSRRRWLQHRQRCARDVRRLQRAMYHREDRSRDINELFAEFERRHGGIIASGRAWDRFKRQSIFSYRPPDYHDDTLSGVQDLGCLVSYALFRNKKTGEHLVTMRDSRGTFAGAERQQAIVEGKTLDAQGKTRGVLLGEARWLWAEHLLRLLRYYPITDRKSVDAMFEAERLRQLPAESPVPALPLRSVFEFFPAFRRAYSGKDGFRRALNHVFGRDGTMRHCIDKGVRHSCWGGCVEGADVAAMYEVHGDQFVKLHEQMGKSDREDFAAGFAEFVSSDALHVVEDISDENERFGVADRIAGSLAILKIAIDHGSGALRCANHLDVFMDVDNEMRAIVTGDQSWLRFRDADAKPIW